MKQLTCAMMLALAAGGLFAGTWDEGPVGFKPEEGMGPGGRHLMLDQGAGREPDFVRSLWDQGVKGTTADSMYEAWVRQYSSGQAWSDDRACAMAVDSSGNVYVTGESTGPGSYYDYATVKYSSAGAVQWVARYNLSGNSEDRATAIAVDGVGNVYVTGYSCGTGGSYDYATVKYDASGVEQWVARYNGPGNSADTATSIAVDDSGNVYVTGASVGSGGAIDYATIKYNSAGVEQWVARYNGPGNADDKAVAIAVDGSGHAYVTGYSNGSGSSLDYVTIKYTSAGVEQWVARYNGPGNADDKASAIAVDSSGNVYVTGTSYGTGSGYDYATVKYDNFGVEQWVERYGGPGSSNDFANAIAVDGSGNVHVTGASIANYSSYDYTTVKYNSDGAQQWVAHYDNFRGTDDKATAIAVDGSGYVYVTGYSYDPIYYRNYDYATIKYNPAGQWRWAVRYCGIAGSDYAKAVAVDASGNVFVTGVSNGFGGCNDYATIKYNNSGAQQWLSLYDGPGDDRDQAYAVAIDGSGNVYVAGKSIDAGGSYDYATVKYSSAGDRQWVARYRSYQYASDSATAIAVDGAENVFVTGVSQSYDGLHDYATIKYNSAGSQQWVARYNGPGNSNDGATDIVVDSSGYVYVTGNSVGSGSSFDYATIKYNSAGVEQWVARYDGPENSSDGANAIAVDGPGNVYVTGASVGFGSSLDYATIKYNGAGVEQWVARYNGPGNDTDYATAIAVDDSGNVYVTGWSVGSGSSFDYATIKYNSAGVEQWVARYNGPGNAADSATSIVVDDKGNVYVTGSSVGSGSSLDYATIKYNAAGVEQWVARYNGPGNSDDQARGIASDISGNVYVTGSSYGSGSSYDYATIKYDSDGAEKWMARYCGSGYSDDQANAIAVDFFGNVYVTGYGGVNYRYVYTTVKYVIDTTDVVVWPGDCDNDGIVTASDVLPIGRFWCLNGPARNQVSTVWEAKSSTMWPRGNIAAYADCDGNGTVDIRDVLAIGQNWKYAHSKNDFQGINPGLDDPELGRYVENYRQIYRSLSGDDESVREIKEVLLSVIKRYERPATFCLSNIYPNPTRGAAQFEFSLSEAGPANVSIYNAVGQLVRILVSEKLAAGRHRAVWDGRDVSGRRVASGVYLCRATVGGRSVTMKLAVVR